MDTTCVSPRRHLPLSADQSEDTNGIDRELAEFEHSERVRLGLDSSRNHWVETMSELKFRREERGQVTILLGGLTLAHDRLVEGAFRGLGYRIKALTCPDQDALRLGKEFGNRGQCNPTYFTVGNLVKYLNQLRDNGMSTQEIIDNHVFLTAGACGPCRFGMYVTEYRKALRDAGFDGFRVLLFQQQGGLSQATGEDVGLEMNPRFFLALLQALMAGDVINALGYRIRPYEVVPGATNAAIEQAKQLCYEALVARRSVYLALRKARAAFAAVQVDRLRPKPRVSIIGEFWAMTTEGDGNYHLQQFIESEGGEVDIQLVTAWLLYNIWEVRFDTKNRASLRGTDGTSRGLAALGEHGVAKRLALLTVAERALRTGFSSYASAIGLKGFVLPDMQEVADIAAPYYNNDLRGGEGHMEVGKVILNAVHKKSTLTVSVKPFGCMPSSGVSDGVQSLVGERFPGMSFCAVETSGDGAANFQSRVQMFLFKARQKATSELTQALEETGLTVDGVRTWLEDHPRFSNSLYRPEHRETTSAADLVYDVAEHIKPGRLQRRLTSTLTGWWKKPAAPASSPALRLEDAVTPPPAASESPKTTPSSKAPGSLAA